jgi:hypothetical protein
MKENIKSVKYPAECRYVVERSKLHFKIQSLIDKLVKEIKQNDSIKAKTFYIAGLYHYTEAALAYSVFSFLFHIFHLAINMQNKKKNQFLWIDIFSIVGYNISGVATFTCQNNSGFIYDFTSSKHFGRRFINILEAMMVQVFIIISYKIVYDTI